MSSADQVPLSMDMDRLIVYCRAVAYKKNEVSDDCCEMYSFNESTISDLITAQSRGLCITLYTVFVKLV